MYNKMEEFFRKRPNMQKKYNFPGTFKDFVKDIAKSVPSKNEKGSHDDLILEEAARLLSKEIPTEDLKNQLIHYPIISYADHHGLLNFKLLYNSNILYSAIIKELKLPFVVVFATGNIPLINVSYPRGFYFKERRFNFFRKKQNNIPVYLLEDKIWANRDGGIESLILNYSSEVLNAEEKKFLEYLFFDCLEIERASEEYEKFSDQLTFLNFKLWKYYFDKSIRNYIVDIVYLQANRIIVNIIIDEIKKKDSLISLILFNPEVRQVFLRNFYGIQCCWGENTGSQLFWGITHKRRLTRLQVDHSSNSLVDKGSDLCIKLEKERIIEALMARKVIHTSFFDLLIMTFLEGYMTLGGFNQIDYLPQMQQAYLKSLREVGREDLVDKFASAVTDGLICGMMPLDFDSGIDLIWNYNSTDGKFNGNLDRGLNQEDLDGILNIPVKNLISTGIETMVEMV